MNPAQGLVSYRNRQAELAVLRQQMQQMRQVQQARDEEDRAARSTFAQITQPLIGSIGNTFSGALGGGAQLLGTGIEAFTPWNGTGQNIRNFGTDFRGDISDAIQNSEFSTMARPGENSFITNVSSGLGSLAASMGGAKLASKLGAGKYSSAVPATAFGASSGGEQAQGAFDAGKSPMQAALTGALAGGVEAGLEKVGIDKYMGAGGGFGRKLATRMATEGIQEGSQSLAQNAVRASYDNVNPMEAIKQAGTEAFYGGIVGGIGGGGGQLAQMAAQNRVPLNEQGGVNNVSQDAQPDPVESLKQEAKKPVDQRGKPKYSPAQVEDSIANMPNIDPRVQTVAANSLQLGSDTAGGYDQKRVDFYKKQLQEGKAVEPIIVTLKDGKMYVQDGKHRLEAAQTLGISEVPIIMQTAKGQQSQQSEMAQVVSEARQYPNTGMFIKAMKEQGRDISKGINGVPFNKIFEQAKKMDSAVSGAALQSHIAKKPK